MVSEVTLKLVIHKIFLIFIFEINYFKDKNVNFKSYTVINKDAATWWLPHYLNTRMVYLIIRYRLSCTRKNTSYLCNSRRRETKTKSAPEKTNEKQRIFHLWDLFKNEELSINCLNNSLIIESLCSYNLITVLL